MSEPIAKLIEKLNRPENVDEDLEDVADNAIDGCARHLQGVGQFILASGPQMDECALPASDFCHIGNLITDLASVIERCQMIKCRGKGGAA